MAEHEEVVRLKHPVSQLQEMCQVWKLPLPTYRECEGSYQAFGTEVTVILDENGEKLSFKALGRTKKASKTNVAQLVLDHVAQQKPQLLEKPEIPEGKIGDEDMPPIWKKGEQANRQHVSSVDQNQLAKETELLAHAHVTLDLARLIQRSRTNISMSQKDLAAKLNEKVSVVVEYEAGKAIPNQQILAKMERVLGVYLRGEKAGQPKLFGRGRGRPH